MFGVLSEARTDARSLTADSKRPGVNGEMQGANKVESGELRREPGKKTMRGEGLPDMKEYIVRSEDRRGRVEGVERDKSKKVKMGKPLLDR